MTSTINDPLKARHRTMWGLGDYPSWPTRRRRARRGPRRRLCRQARRRGARHRRGRWQRRDPRRPGGRVVASDRTPALLDAGKARAGDLAIRWEEADAEALPYADGAFDVVLSCLGVMFAPHHQAGADELVRVCRSGGTIGLLSWTPGGFVGQLFAT
jgi:SAM-dependent methyltransferase